MKEVPAIQLEVISIVEWFKGRLPSQFPAERLDYSLDDAVNGEATIGLQDLCSNLHDFDVAVPAEMIARIAAAGRELGLEERYWLNLLPG